MNARYPHPITQRRLEGAAMLAAFATAYAHLDFSWATFWIWFFLPDLPMLIYIVDARVGAYAYNTTHCYVWPALLALVAITTGSSGAEQAALIWACHIANDRMLGWGLKYDADFFHTDLGTRSLPFRVGFLEPKQSG